MTRDIEVFRQLPENLRRYIILLMRRFHKLGYQLMRPLQLDMRRVQPVNDFNVYHVLPASVYRGIQITTLQWLGLDYDNRIASGIERGKFKRAKIRFSE